MERKNIGSTLILALTALIWGVAFVAQSVGMDYVGPFTFNGVRSIIGGLVLIPCIFVLDKINGNNNSDKRINLIKGGISCGVILFIASSFQQFGIMYTSVGKAGFITALYIVIVPILGLFLKRKLGNKVWVSIVLAILGMYFLCMPHFGGGVQVGDILMLAGAFFFSIHILVIDYYVNKNVDGVRMSCMQFIVCGILSLICMFTFETPKISSLLQAWVPILYAGILSCAVAYTLQIIGQKRAHPVVASLVLSLESVFSVLAGWFILKQELSKREILGCILVFVAIIIAQIPRKMNK